MKSEQQIKAFIAGIEERIGEINKKRLDPKRIPTIGELAKWAKEVSELEAQIRVLNWVLNGPELKI